MNASFTETYLVKKINHDVIITGDGAAAAWSQAELLCDFTYPWESEPAPRTTFRGLHSAQWLYFLFDVEDSRVHVDFVEHSKLEVIDSSRVEIFLRRNENMSPYYCLELDASGRVLDYVGHFHRQFDFQWSWPPESLKVSAIRRSHGYTVEGAISKSSLASLGVLTDNNRLQAGLFRAECTRTVTPRDHMRWISWRRPDAPTPDFHIPSAFGILQLAD